MKSLPGDRGEVQAIHKTEAYFVYPREIRNARRLTAFRDFLIGKVAKS